MYEIGRLCVKLAGRDSRKKCVIIEVLDNNYVMIDGQTRRRKCNINHLEPLDKVLKIKKKATHSEVKTALKKEKIEVIDTKPKKAKERPRKLKKAKEVVKTVEPKEKEKPKAKKTSKPKKSEKKVKKK